MRRKSWNLTVIAFGASALISPARALTFDNDFRAEKSLSKVKARAGEINAEAPKAITVKFQDLRLIFVHHTAHAVTATRAAGVLDETPSSHLIQSVTVSLWSGAHAGEI